jgi:hypothetical protein
MGSVGGACGSGEIGVVGKLPVKTGGGGTSDRAPLPIWGGGRSVWIESWDG